MSLSFKLAGVTRTSNVCAPNGTPSISITEQLLKRYTASFTYMTAAGGTAPAAGQVVEIYDGLTLIFAGRIESVTRRVVPGVNTAAVGSETYDCRCTDYNSCADNRSAGSRRWNEQKLNDIIRELVTKCLSGDGVTLGSVPANTGPVIKEYATDYCTVAEAFDAVCNLAGGYAWRIGYDKALQVYQPALQSVFATIGNGVDARVLEGSVSLSEDLSQYGNRVVGALGHFLTEQQTKTITVSTPVQPIDGVRREFFTDYAIAATPSITVDDVAQSVGVRGSTGVQWYWSKGSNVVEQDDQQAVLTSGTLSITHIGVDARELVYQNNAEIAARAAIEGGSGIHEKIVRTDEEMGAADAEAFLNAELDRIDSPSYILRFEWMGSPWPEPGRRITWNRTGYPAGDYIIRNVTLSYVGPETQAKFARRRVEAVNGPLLMDGIDSLKKIAGQTAAPSIGGNSQATSPTSVEAPNPPTGVTVTVIDYGADYGLLVEWTAPGTPGGTNGYDVEAQFYSDSGAVTAESDPIPLGALNGLATVSAEFSRYPRPGTANYVRARVRGRNANNEYTAWVQSATPLPIVNIDAGGSTVPDPAVPTGVTCALIDSGDRWGISTAWTAPNPLAGTTAYELQVQIATNTGFTSLDLDWTDLGGVTGGPVTSHRAGPFDRQDKTRGNLYARTRIRALNSDNDVTAWVTASNYATITPLAAPPAPAGAGSTRVDYKVIAGTPSYRFHLEVVPNASPGTTVGYWAECQYYSDGGGINPDGARIPLTGRMDPSQLVVDTDYWPLGAATWACIFYKAENSDGTFGAETQSALLYIVASAGFDITLADQTKWSPWVSVDNGKFAPTQKNSDNALADGSFTKDSAWSLYNNSVTPWTVDNTVFHSAPRCYRVDGNAGNVGKYAGISSTNDALNIARVGDQIALDIWVRQTGATGTIAFSVIEWDAAFAVVRVAASVTATVNTLSGSWQKLSCAGIVSGATTRYFGLNIQVTGCTSGSIWVDDPTVRMYAPDVPAVSGSVSAVAVIQDSTSEAGAECWKINLSSIVLPTADTNLRAWKAEFKWTDETVWTDYTGERATTETSHISDIWPKGTASRNVQVRVVALNRDGVPGATWTSGTLTVAPSVNGSLKMSRVDPTTLGSTLAKVAGVLEVKDSSLQAVKLAPGALADLTRYSSTVRPLVIVTSLPGLPDVNYPVGSAVLNTTNGKLYRNVSGAWSTAADGSDIQTGTIGANVAYLGSVSVGQLTTGTCSVSVFFQAGRVQLNLGGVTSRFDNFFESTLGVTAGFETRNNANNYRLVASYGGLLVLDGSNSIIVRVGDPTSSYPTVAILPNNVDVTLRAAMGIKVFGFTPRSFMQAFAFCDSNGNAVLSTRQPIWAVVSGGSVVDVEARAALASIRSIAIAHGWAA